MKRSIRVVKVIFAGTAFLLRPLLETLISAIPNESNRRTGYEEPDSERIRSGKMSGQRMFRPGNVLYQRIARLFLRRATGICRKTGGEQSKPPADVRRIRDGRKIKAVRVQQPDKISEL